MPPRSIYKRMWIDIDFDPELGAIRFKIEEPVPTGGSEQGAGLMLERPLLFP